MNNVLLKNYTVPKLDIPAVSDSNGDYADDRYVYTTLPLRNVDDTSADNLDFSSQCLLHIGKPKYAILATPGFPKSVPRPPQIRHLIAQSTHGLGMFATTDLAR
ncbi:hypothetical protein C0991_005849 [Blastosporella zonata]|nr:hypothetical protein C0991_005849 [Blastosporella zonata]